MSNDTETNTDRCNDILDHALKLAMESSWEAFSLSELASQSHYSLVDIKRIFRSKDDMAEAFFNRADEAMLLLSEDSEFSALSNSDRLVKCTMTWFNALAPYRVIVKEMMAYKLEPGHFHLQAHGVTRVSRTVQWFLEVSQRNHSGLKRVADEIAVTSAYLTAFAYFLYDDTENSNDTEVFLKKLINKIDKAHLWFG